jgi:hypothetical protein
MMRNKNPFWSFMFVWCSAVLFSLTLWTLILYAAVHFIRKYW